MAETRSQKFKQLNLFVLKALKEKYPHVLDRDLTQQIDLLTIGWNQVERVEFSRAPEPVPTPTPPPPNDEKVHQYENPNLLKFPTDQKHMPLRLRSSSPFEEKFKFSGLIGDSRPNARAGSPFEDLAKSTVPPLLPSPSRGVDMRANPPQESSPALPPRSELNIGKQELGFRPIAAKQSPQDPPYFNVPSNNQKYKTQVSRDNQLTTREMKQVADEPLPIRLREQQQQQQQQSPQYINTRDTNPLNVHFPDAKKLGLLGELKQTLANKERASPYGSPDETKRIYPHHDIGKDYFEDLGEGMTIIDGETGPMGFQGLYVTDKTETLPFQNRPRMPKPYQSQSSEDLGSEDRPTKIADPMQTPELPPKVLPKSKTSTFTTNLEAIPKEVSYANVLHDLQKKERTRIHFDNSSNVAPTVPSRPVSEESSEQRREIRSPVRKELEPSRTEEGYLVMHTSRDEDCPSPGTYEEISYQREGTPGVFNIRDLISEKTELLGLDGGIMKRQVLTEKVASKDESEFYDLVSNKSMFFLHLTDHSILTQEILSLSNPLYMELHNILYPYYKFNFANLKVSLGPAVGLLETASSNVQKKKFFQTMISKKEETLDIAKSLLQMKITTSHIIYLSQPGSEFDEMGYEQHMNDRDQNTRDRFHRAFIPLIQGAQPLSKHRISNLIVYLGNIFNFKEIQMFIPDAYKHDTEMLFDIKTSLHLCQRSAPEEVIPQVIELAEESRLRDSVYFRVKVNNKMTLKLNDTILGINPRNIHLISISQNEEIDLCLIWSSVDIKLWSNVGGLMVEFKDGKRLLMSSPDNEKIIHEILKMQVNPKKILVNY